MIKVSTDSTKHCSGSKAWMIDLRVVSLVKAKRSADPNGRSFDSTLQSKDFIIIRKSAAILFEALLLNIY